jgi:hypothetical protein
MENPVQAVFFLLFGVPILFRLAGLMLVGVLAIGIFGTVLNPDRVSIENAVTVDDIAFGEAASFPDRK